MEYKQLGKSELHISRIGFGAMSLKSGEAEGIALLHQAIDSGINFIDTADLYDKGLNEEIVGKALKGRREQVIVATKVGNQWRPDGSGWDWNPRKEYILESIEKSLRRLNIDQVDLYQLHGGTIDDPIDEVIETFEKLQQQGKIRYYGISSIRPNVIREYVNRSSIVSVMSQYSLLDRRPEEQVLQLLLQNNIGVLVRGALAQGLLINKPAKEYLGHSSNAVEQASSVVHQLSSQRNAAQTAIQYVLHHPAITSAVVGVSNKKQLQEVIAMTKENDITKEEYEFLRNAVKQNFYDVHR